jgi:hypothetical protein
MIKNKVLPYSPPMCPSAPRQKVRRLDTNESKNMHSDVSIVIKLKKWAKRFQPDLNKPNSNIKQK